MRISRREFIKYCTIAAGALGLTTTDLLKIEEAFGKMGDPNAPQVVWIPGQACTGCTMALTNSVFYATIKDLAVDTVNIAYNEQLNAAAGELAVDSAISAIGKPMVLVLEGAIPHGPGRTDEFCTIWTRTSGIIAAGSKINGDNIAEGKLTRKLTSKDLIANDVIKAGSELAANQTFPAGTIVANAGDRAALGGSYVGSAVYGGDILNTNVTLAAELPVTGTINIWGGTSAPVNTIATGSTLAIGAIVESSFDRFWLSNQDTSLPAIKAIPAATFGDDGNGNPWLLTNAPVLQVARSVAGPFIIGAGSILATGTVLKAGTKVTASADQLAIDPSLVKFGYGSASASNVLATASTALAADYVLTGDISMASNPPAITLATLGFGADDKDKTMLNESRLFATSAAAVLCVGTCSSFGGIPAAKGNVTGASGALYKGAAKPGKYNGAMTEFAAKTVNIPGCPPHPDWIVGTIAYLLKTNFQIPELEAYARPMAYYGQYQCNAGPCEWRYNQGYNATEEANYYNPKALPGHAFINSSKLYKFKWAPSTETATLGQRAVGCIGALGCKGRKTKADCSLRRWNGDAALQYGTNWCVGSGAGCHGCTEPTFPDKVGKFFNFA